MDQQRYWRNLIADQIKEEHDRVKKYYMKKGMNSGGMSTEEHTRLNIFMLCDSIVRTVTDAPDAPTKKAEAPIPVMQEIVSIAPEPIPEPVEEPPAVIISEPTLIEDDINELNDFIEEQTAQVWEDVSDNEQKKDDVNNQNQFGEFF